MKPSNSGFGVAYTNKKLKDAWHQHKFYTQRNLQKFTEKLEKEKTFDTAKELKKSIDDFVITPYHHIFPYGNYVIYNTHFLELGLDEYAIESIGIDAEWFTKLIRAFSKKKIKPTDFISKQATLFTVGGHKIHIVLLNRDFPCPSDKVFHFLGDTVIVLRSDIQEKTIPQVIKDLGLHFKMVMGKDGKYQETKIPVYMYFSPNDIRCLIHTHVMRCMTKGYLHQEFEDSLSFKPKKHYSCFTKKRNISGKLPFEYGLYEPPLPVSEDYFAPHNPLREPVLKDTDEYAHVVFVLKDLIGAFNSSLDKAFDLAGIFNITKDLVDPKRKANMNEVAAEDMDLFFIYLLGDTLNLFKMWQNRVYQINKIVLNACGFDPEFTVDKCPRTLGALVSEVFMLFLEHKYPFHLAGVEAMARPYQSDRTEWIFQQYLDSLPSQKENIKKGFVSLYKSKKAKHKTDIRLSQLHKLWNGYDRQQKTSLDGVCGLARASIGGFAGLSNDNTMFNAIVLGGRCNNENPTQFKYVDIFDIDLSSCYGTALEDLIFPFGKPSIIDGTLGKDKDLTWEQFEQKYVLCVDEKKRPLNNQEQFVDGMWQAVLSNQLDKNGKRIPFKNVRQDYLYGKPTVTIASINNDVKDGYHHDDTTENNTMAANNADLTYSIEKSHIHGDIRLGYNEIHNAIVTTHDFPNIVNKIASQRERAELNQVRVITAAGYKKSDEVKLVLGDGYSDVGEKFFDLICNPKIRGDWKVKSDVDTQITVDGRHNLWIGLPLKEFIGAFISYRKGLKKLKKQYEETDPAKSHQYDVEQEACKLFINTLYGCLASPFFPISNAILANNITSKARFGVWMINKALGTAMSITDGGAYSNNTVRFLDPSKCRNMKPSLKDLSDYKLLNKHRCITKGNLVDNFDWIYNGLKLGIIDKLDYHKRLDVKATNHINNFWSHYGLKLEFEIEHKANNTCKSMILYNKSDYLFIEPLKADKSCLIEDGVVKNIDIAGKYPLNYTPKVRGAKQDDHVKKMWLLALAGYVKFTRSMIEYEYEQVIGLNDIIKSLRSLNTLAKDWVNDDDGAIAGESELKKTIFNPATNYFHKGFYSEHSEQERNNLNRKKVLFQQIKLGDSPFNKLLKMVLDKQGYVQEKKLQKILNNGGYDYIAKFKF